MACHTGIVVEYLVLPVCSLAVAVRIVVDGGLSCVHQTFVPHHRILSGVEHVAMFPRVLPSVREVIVDAHLALLASLCGDEDNAVGGTRTVDGARSSVLEHLDGLDVARVKIVDAAFDGHSVHDVERV